MSSSKLIIDVREPWEYSNSHAQGAINIPLSKLEGAKELNDHKNSQILVYCNSGRRSEIAKQILEAQGFSDVVNAINQLQLDKK